VAWKRLEEDEAGLEVRGAPNRRCVIRGTIQIRAQQQGKRVPTSDRSHAPSLGGVQEESKWSADS